MPLHLLLMLDTAKGKFVKQNFGFYHVGCMLLHAVKFACQIHATHTKLQRVINTGRYHSMVNKIIFWVFFVVLILFLFYFLLFFYSYFTLKCFFTVSTYISREHIGIIV